MYCSVKDSIFWFAIYSRITVLFISFISNLLIPDHNAKDVFIYKNDDVEEDLNLLDHIIKLLFGGLIRWDANYFLHISHYGYTRENMLAFFPLFPFIVRLTASFFNIFLNHFLLYSSLLLLSSIVINFVLFIKSALVLYDLTLKFFNDYRIAYYSAIIFCVNPASIFFTAPYSESIYSFLVFSLILNCFNDKFIISSMISGLSCAARSNGTINVGFILYTFFVFFIRHFSLSFFYLFSAITIITIFTVISLAPFVLFQLYSFIKFCLDTEMNSPLSKSWCNSSLPLAYSHVQKHYWDVGFLHYYQFKQIPNFLLAFPIIFIILRNCYVKLNEKREILIKMCKLQIIWDLNSNKLGVINELNYIIVITHAALLTIFCILFVHIQVTTRMLCSSSPVVYWFVADCFKKNNNSSDKYSEKLSGDLIDISLKTITNSKKSPTGNNYSKDVMVKKYVHDYKYYYRMFFNKSNDCYKIFYIRLYFISYFIVGTVLFSNFYPWT